LTGSTVLHIASESIPARTDDEDVWFVETDSEWIAVFGGNGIKGHGTPS
jgi:hypothetical protein